VESFDDAYVQAARRSGVTQAELDLASAFMRKSKGGVKPTQAELDAINSMNNKMLATQPQRQAKVHALSMQAAQTSVEAGYSPRRRAREARSKAKREANEARRAKLTPAQRKRENTRNVIVGFVIVGVIVTYIIVAALNPHDKSLNPGYDPCIGNQAPVACEMKKKEDREQNERYKIEEGAQKIEQRMKEGQSGEEAANKAAEEAAHK